LGVETADISDMDPSVCPTLVTLTAKCVLVLYTTQHQQQHRMSVVNNSSYCGRWY